MTSALRPSLLPCLLLGLLAGCEEDQVDTTTRIFERAWDAALVCAVRDTGTGEWTGAAPAECGEDGDGSLFAFVVQTTRGEVGVVDLSRGRMLDLDRREPLQSPIEVGPTPNAIAASPDGAFVAVANLGADPTDAVGPYYLSILTPTNSIRDVARDPDRLHLDAPAAEVLFLDARHLAVAQPTASKVTLITLADDPDASVRREVILEPFPLLGPGGETLPGLPRPWSLDWDAGRRRLLVGDRNAGRLAWLSWDGGEELALEAAVDLPGPATALAVEPADPAGTAPGRWVYAVNGTSGGVMVLDADTLAMVDVSAHDPLEWRPEIMLPGLARDVVIGRIALESVPSADDPERLHGVFAFVISSAGGVYVVDIEDRANGECWDSATPGEGRYREDVCPRHVLRSALPATSLPHPESSPSVYGPTGTPIPYTEVVPPEYTSFHDWDSTDGQDNRTYGITFDPDRRRAVNQTWTLEFEGVIPWTNGVGGNIEPGNVLADRALPFCSRGVQGASADYLGDVLSILDGPSPLDESTDCSAYGTAESPRELEYRVAEAYQGRLVLAPLGDAPLPTEECFPFAVRYEVRVSGRWLVWGGATGFQHRVVAEEGTERCVEDPACPAFASCTDEVTDFRCLWNGRADAEAYYRNPYLCFRLRGPTSGPPGRGSRLEFDTVNGFDALDQDGGSLPVAAVLDETGATGPALLVVDSASDGLIRIDLDGFSVSNTWE